MRQLNISNSISGFSGIKPSSANTVLSFAALAAITPTASMHSCKVKSIPFLGRYAPVSICRVHWAPITWVILAPGPYPAAEAVGDKLGSATTTATETGNNWLWPLLWLLAPGLLIWFFFQRGCSYASSPVQVAEAVGHGPDHPVCAADDTPECKAQNPRVDLKVASK